METLKEANPFNEDPQEGYEYMMSKIHYIISSKMGKPQIQARGPRGHLPG